MNKENITALLNILWEFSLKIDQKPYYGSLYTYNVTGTLKQPFWKPENNF